MHRKGSTKAGTGRRSKGTMRLLPLAIAAALLSLPAIAAADPYSAPPIFITLRPERPLVTEIAKPAATLDPAKTRIIVTPKIEGAVRSSPF
jgi:hypothetical protein